MQEPTGRYLAFSFFVVFIIFFFHFSDDRTMSDSRKKEGKNGMTNLLWLKGTHRFPFEGTNCTELILPYTFTSLFSDR
jgi:hypothetical protein